MKKLLKNKKLNQKGIATIESVLLLSIFVVFMTYCVGTFGIVHTGILNSISARAYAFETFRNRANVNYFRDDPAVDLDYFMGGIRAHGISTENNGGQQKWYATTRLLAMGRDVATVANRPQGGQDDQLFDKKREMSGKVNPVYIKVVYGICLNFACGG
jgi:hypothetical protein